MSANLAEEELEGLVARGTICEHVFGLKKCLVEERTGIRTERLTPHAESDCLLKGSFPSVNPLGTIEGCLYTLASLDDGTHDIV